MSIETVNQFLIKVNQDPQLQAEVEEAIETGNARQAVTELGAKHGYQFTSKQLSSQFSSLQTQSVHNQLSEEELEAVAGGATPASPAIVGAGASVVSAVAGVGGAAAAGTGGDW